MHARDPADLYKDRIEVSLDGRQIFYLFFGGAVIVGLVFVLGVMVGRRVEARGHVDLAGTAAAADPLAALDRLEAPGGLTFKGALTGTAGAQASAPAPTEVERAIGELEKAGAVKPAVPSAPMVAAKVEKKQEKAEEPKVEKAEKSEKADRPEKSEKAEKSEKSDKKESRKKKKGDGDADAGPARFTLQLSSFQDRQEADAFLSTLKAAGFQAYVTEIDVGSKGTFYRVRYGSYRTADAASDAKAELERVTRKSASVMRL
jgi:DedD protein